MCGVFVPYDTIINDLVQIYDYFQYFQDTLKKIKNEDTNISLESLNRICIILDMQPKDLIEYVENKEEKKRYNF